ncbi:MAG: hypothetical protein OEY96_06980 [Gammaproteobacteria bacterium]|nr:hypothetical protein [Gammaproteobacteria bacterium]
MGKKTPETVRLRVKEQDDLMNKAWELSEKGKIYRESELVHFLIENGLHRIIKEDGELILK